MSTIFYKFFQLFFPAFPDNDVWYFRMISSTTPPFYTYPALAVLPVSGKTKTTGHIKRRRRDLNPRAATNDLLPFQGSPFGQLGYFSIKRRGWDSNPRALSDKRFSRPPRYDHFDTSPSLALKRVQLQRRFLRRCLFYHICKTCVNTFFTFYDLKNLLQ